MFFSHQNMFKSMLDCSAQLPAPLHMRPEVARPQTHLYIQSYMTDGDWKLLRDEKVNFAAKMKCLVDRAIKLGICSLHEKTKVDICVLLVAGSVLYPI